MIKEFKSFIMRGNVIDLAVGVIIGGAFGKIVTSLVNDLLMPVIGMILGKVNFTELKLVITPPSEGIPEAAIRYGAFIQSVIDFAIIGTAIFFMIKLLSVFKKKQEKAAGEPPAPPKSEMLLEEIRDLLKQKN